MTETTFSAETALRQAGLRIANSRVRVLCTLAGLLRRIEPAGSAALYELDENDDHHIVCNSCRNVVDVESAVGHSPRLSSSDSSGFQISTAQVTFGGLCQDCARLDRIHSSTIDRENL